MTNPNDAVHEKQTITRDGETMQSSSLTKREYFAAAALTGLMFPNDFASLQDRVNLAVMAADEIIKALNKQS